MTRRAVTMATLVMTVLMTGCLSETGLDPNAGLPDATELLERPWLDNWSTKASNFTVHYDPGARHLSGEGTLTLVNTVGEERAEVWLLIDSYTITKLEDDAGQAISYEESEVSLVATLMPEELSNGVAGLRAISFELDGDVAPWAERVIHIAFEGWGGSDENVPGGAPNDLAANYHGPLLPLTGFFRTLTDNQVTITHPSDWTVLAAAEPQRTEVDGAWTTTHYRINEPRTILFSANGLQFLEEEVNGVEVRTYFYPDMAVQGRTTHDISVRALQFNEAVGTPYPYDHLWTVPHQVAANAFSTPGLTFMGLNFYRFTVPYVPLQFSRISTYAAGHDSFEMVVVHEHTHNWWGHNVRYNNSDASLGPREVWITEGVTTYLSELVWFDRVYGPEDGAASAWAKVFDQHTRRARSGEQATTEAGGDAYEKGAMMLRGLEAYGIATGRPDAVLEGLNLVQERHGRLQGHDGIVDSQDMIDAFEVVFAEDLAWHFEPLLFGDGLPDLKPLSFTTRDQAIEVELTNEGQVKAAALVRAVLASGDQLDVWTVVDAGETTTVTLDVPNTVLLKDVVRIELDPYQHINEGDEADNVLLAL